PYNPPHRDPHSFPTRRSSDLTLVVQDFGQRKGKGATLQGGHDARDDFAQRFEMVAAFQRDHEPAPAKASGQRGSPGHQVHVGWRDRKSTRLNSSHVAISYAVF